MPYRLRKVPKKDLYWVIGEDGTHHSKEGLPKKRAEAQMKALYIAMRKEKKGGSSFAEDTLNDPNAGPDIPASAMKPKGDNLTLVGGLPLFIYWTICRQTYKLIHGLFPQPRIANPAEGEDDDYRPGANDPGIFKLVAQTPTILLYSNGSICIIGCRGSVTAEDWKANTQIPLNKLYWTDRISKDIQFITTEQKKLRLQNPHIKFYATGHSLGGAVSDILVAHNFASLAVTYNPAIEPQYKHSSKNHRIYNEWDPLYAIMGRFATTFQVRRGDKRPDSWLEKFAKLSPWGILYTKAMGALYAHQLERFMGGGKAKAKNALYGGQQCRTFTEEQCVNELSGYFDPDTQNCFQDGVNLGEKDCDGPTPPAPKPFNPVPGVPGQPDKPPTPPPKPLPPNGYNPNDKPQPLPPNGLKPVNPPFIPVPGQPGGTTADIALCYEGPSTQSKQECNTFQQKLTEKFNVRLNIARAKYINNLKDLQNDGQSHPNNVKENRVIINPPIEKKNASEGTLVPPMWQYVKEDGSFQWTKSPQIVKNHPWDIENGKSAQEFWDGKDWNGTHWVAVPDPYSEATNAKLRRMLADDGWLDAKYEDTLYTDIQQYYKLIPKYCGENLPGKKVPCPQPATPETLFNNCVDSGFPNWNETQFNANRDALYYHKYEKPPVEADIDISKIKPLQKKKVKGGINIPGNYGAWNGLVDYKKGDIVQYLKLNKNYISLQDHNKNNAPDAPGQTVWEVYVPPSKPKAPEEWDRYKRYVITSTVSHNGKVWKSNYASNLGKEPGVVEGPWSEITPDQPPTPPPPAPTPSAPAGIVVLGPIDYNRPRDQKKAKDFLDKYGSTYQEFVNKRTKFCEEQSKQENYATYQEWWDNIGSKYNSPCKLSGLDTGDPLPYNPGKINNDLDRPICRQWRAKADKLTKQMGPDAFYDEENTDPNNPGNKLTIRRLKGLEYEKRIPPYAWKGYDDKDPTKSHFVNDNSKWIWQHEITTPRKVMGLDIPIPGGCPLPPGVIPMDDSFTEPMGPDACLAKQRELYNLAKTSIEGERCVNKGLACKFDETYLPSLMDWVVNLIKGKIPELQNLFDFKKEMLKLLVKELFGADPTARKVTKSDPLKTAGWITTPGEQDTREGAKAVANWAGNLGIEELFKILQSLVPGPAFGSMFGTPANVKHIMDTMAPDKVLPGYFDPLEGRRIPPQNTNERLVQLLGRRVSNTGPLYEGAVHPKDWDNVGYDVELENQANTNITRIRGGKHKEGLEVYRRAVKRMLQIVDMAKEMFGDEKLSGGARPHHKFEKHLISYGISPDVYLNHARQKAKKAGLPSSLLGFADDEKHKLTIPNEAGHLVSFGSAGMGDHILYSLLKDPKADQHRSSYLARATKIRGDWKKSPYSANSLAIKVLW